MSHFFIDRPIFAWVIAIMLMLFGGIVMQSTPVEQYPEIAPTAVSISANYPGASAPTVENSVTQIIEQQMTGLDHYTYMASTSDSSGNASITITFSQDADPDIAQVQVQNKLQLANAMLPEEVQRQGISVKKTTSTFFLVLAFISKDGSMNESDIADYMNSFLVDPLSRVDGVGDSQVFGSQYAMRIWIDPGLLQKYNLNVSDITSVIQSQNMDVAAGQLGAAPAVPGQTVNFTVKAQTLLTSIDEFKNIIVKSNEDGSLVRISDVARVDLDGERIMAYASYFNDKASGIGIKLATGANALDTKRKVMERLNELQDFFPEGLAYEVAYDTTPFVEISMHEVKKTLFEAIVLVFLLMFLFLQNFRSTLIPTIAIPVVLLGTLGIIGVAGFSINTLTMLALVLAIGLLVDDAIVVVENVERVMAEDRSSPKEAAKKSMHQITSALVGIGIILSAVFVPMAFFGGSTGVIYRQFSITIVSAMLLSVAVALILTPSLCAQLLKPVSHTPTGGFFGWFNRTFEKFVKHYTNSVDRNLRKPLIAILIFLVICALVYHFLLRLPTSFLPEEDQGVLMLQIQLPENASFERTEASFKLITSWLEENEKDNIESIMTVSGFSFNGIGQNVGLGFVRLKDWSLRTKADQTVFAIAQRASVGLSQMPDATVFVLVPPAIISLGTSSGFDVQLMNNSGMPSAQFDTVMNEMLQAARQNPVLNPMTVRHNGRSETTIFNLQLDNEKVMAQNLDMSTVLSTISTLWGGTYVNNFLHNGRAKKVYVQLDAPFRMQPENFNSIYVRNNLGQSVPLASVFNTSWGKESPMLERYNGVPSKEILGAAATGKSSGEAMTTIEEIAASLPSGVGISWTGLSYQERLSGDQAPALYAISLVVVFLCLAALYESWAIPFAVILVIPLGVLGSVLAATIFGQSNDVYFQVGLLTIIGLSAKNAILIVEFAKTMEEQGMPMIEAAVEACRLRVRPIIMTSFAFILGVLPLALSTGAGSGSHKAIGVGVVGGMITATVLGIYYIPILFVLVSRLFGVKLHGPTNTSSPTPPTGEHLVQSEGGK